MLATKQRRLTAIIEGLWMLAKAHSVAFELAQREHAESHLFEAFAAADIGKIHHEAALDHFAAHLLNQRRSRRRRDAINSVAKLVLNLPQNPGWRWISTMRVLAGMRCRRATAAIGNYEPTAIAPFCITIASNEVLRNELSEALAKYDTHFEHLHERYETFVHSAANASFPHDELDLWARLEL